MKPAYCWIYEIEIRCPDVECPDHILGSKVVARDLDDPRRTAAYIEKGLRAEMAARGADPANASGAAVVEAFDHGQRLLFSHRLNHVPFDRLMREMWEVPASAGAPRASPPRCA